MIGYWNRQLDVTATCHNGDDVELLMPTLKKTEKMSDINKTISEGLGWEKEALSVSKSVLCRLCTLSQSKHGHGAGYGLSVGIDHLQTQLDGSDKNKVKLWFRCDVRRMRMYALCSSIVEMNR